MSARERYRSWAAFRWAHAKRPVLLSVEGKRLWSGWRRAGADAADPDGSGDSRERVRWHLQAATDSVEARGAGRPGMRPWWLILACCRPGGTAAPGVEALTVTSGRGRRADAYPVDPGPAADDGADMLPGALILMTSFTRIVIVLSILRQALGTAQTPSNQILIGLALF